MPLSDKRILHAMESGALTIDPFDQLQLGTNSYDCRLGEWYYLGNSDVHVIHLTDKEEMYQYWGEPRQATSGEIMIPPGTMILAHTEEYIGCIDGLVAMMHSRSSIARSGLSVCRCAGVGDVGYCGRWTMEIVNHTHALIALPVGIRICQFIFEDVGETLKDYRGAHNGKYGRQTHLWSPEDMLPKMTHDWDHARYVPAHTPVPIPAPVR